MASLRRAFTLVELLVVIGIIALVGAILLPALAGARDNARRIRCAANLHNIAGAVGVYASECRGRLPVQDHQFIAATWALPVKTRDVLVKAGMARQNFYCPSRDPSDDDGIWDMLVWPGYCATGYYWLMGRTDGFTTGPFAEDLPKFLGYPAQYGDAFRKVRWRMDLPRASEMELVTDQTVTLNGGPHLVFRPADGVIGHGTNHLRRGQRQGGQILFLDGHVAWRPFSEMRIRFVPGDTEWF